MKEHETKMLWPYKKWWFHLVSKSIGSIRKAIKIAYIKEIVRLFSHVNLTASTIFVLMCFNFKSNHISVLNHNPLLYLFSF